MPEAPWKPGLVLAGRYRLEVRMGEGGMGTIWRAEHLVLAAPVAVKLIDPQVATDEDAVARFMREAQSAATLRSPHVVQIIDYGVDEQVKTPFIVMELLEGENLAQRIKRLGRLSPAETTRVLAHVARAVGRAHDAGIVHRDLKPENVFIVHNEDDDIAKVLDFGVAKVDRKIIGANAVTRTGSLLGTPYYMSPEQAQGNKTVDHRSDLWSLGVIAFECLTGKRPFFSDAIGDLVLQICVRDIPIPSQSAPVPARFDAWFARAVARDPDLRFQSARELVESLREALGVEGRETIATLSDADSARRMRLASSSGGSTVVAAAEELPPQGSHAPTVAVTPHKPSLTVQQFGTTSLTPPPVRSGAPLVFGVAITALVIGLVAGFIVLRGKIQSERAQSAPLQPAIPGDPPELIGAGPSKHPAPADSSQDQSEAADSAVAEAVDAAPDQFAAAPARDGRKPRPHEKPEAVPPPRPEGSGPYKRPAWSLPDDDPRKDPAPPPGPGPAPHSSGP